MAKMSDYYVKVGDIYPYIIRHNFGDMMEISQSVLTVNDSTGQLDDSTVYSNCDANGNLSQKAPTGTLQYTTQSIEGQIIKGSPCYLHIYSSERAVSNEPFINEDGSYTSEVAIERNINLSGMILIKRIKYGDNDWEYPDPNSYNAWSSHEASSAISRIDVILEVVGLGGQVALYADGRVIKETTWPN